MISGFGIEWRRRLQPQACMELVRCRSINPFPYLKKKGATDVMRLMFCFFASVLGGPTDTSTCYPPGYHATSNYVVAASACPSVSIAIPEHRRNFGMFHPLMSCSHRDLVRHATLMAMRHPRFVARRKSIGPILGFAPKGEHSLIKTILIRFQWRIPVQLWDIYLPRSHHHVLCLPLHARSCHHHGNNRNRNGNR